MEGYCLLGERLRTQEERAFIKRVIEKHCSGPTGAKKDALPVDPRY